MRFWEVNEPGELLTFSPPKSIKVDVLQLCLCVDCSRILQSIV